MITTHIPLAAPAPAPAPATHAPSTTTSDDSDPISDLPTLESTVSRLETSIAATARLLATLTGPSHPLPTQIFTMTRSIVAEMLPSQQDALAVLRVIGHQLPSLVTANDNLQDQARDLVQAIVERDTRITALEQQLALESDNAARLHTRLTRADALAAETAELLAHRNTTVERLEANVDELRNAIRGRDGELAKLTADANAERVAAQVRVNDFNKQMATMRAKLTAANAHATELRDTVAERDRQLQDADGAKHALATRMSRVHAEMGQMLAKLDSAPPTPKSALPRRPSPLALPLSPPSPPPAPAPAVGGRALGSRRPPAGQPPSASTLKRPAQPLEQAMAPRASKARKVESSWRGNVVM